MSQPSIDLKSLTVVERCELIKRLWSAIVDDAERGDPAAVEAIALDKKVDPELLAELVRRADEFERDPSKGVQWEALRKELQRKYG
jgi:putative addiction module component (TIGR02574 family)